MVQVQQRLLAKTAALVCALLLPSLEAKRLYDDDPLWIMPKPIAVPEARDRELNAYYDFFYNTFGKPGEHPTPQHPIPAEGVNTLGEVPDSLWYTNRHGKKRMTLQELVRGPGNETPPSTKGPWRVLSAKTEGVTPGLTIADTGNHRYLLKFDPMKYPELASAVDVIGTKFFYALGYNTPENYIVYFNAEQLVVDPKAKIRDRRGLEREMRQGDVASVLSQVPRDAKGRYRAVASLYLAGKPVGPFRYDGTRGDDPNDIYKHENRRDLRGLAAFSAWLNHTDTKSINSLDTLVEMNEVKVIKHHLIDFGAILGSDSFMPKSPRNGNVFMFDWSSSAREFLTLGLYIPRWMRADYPEIPGAGRLEYEVFDPAEWRSNYYNPAFANALPDDFYWATKQVMAFTDQEIRAIVETGDYSNPAATDWVTKCIIERRNKVGRTWFSKVLPIDNFRVENGVLLFDDLGEKYGFNGKRQFSFTWSSFDNGTGTLSPIGAATTQLPRKTGRKYLAVEIRSDDLEKSVTVYLRDPDGRPEIAGADRHW